MRGPSRLAERDWPRPELLALLVLLLLRVLLPLADGRVALNEASGEESLSLRGEPRPEPDLPGGWFVPESLEPDMERMKEDFVADDGRAGGAGGMVLGEDVDVGWEPPDEAAERDARAGRVGLGEVGGGGSNFLPGREVDREVEVVVLPAVPNTTPSCLARGEISWPPPPS